MKIIHVFAERNKPDDSTRLRMPSPIDNSVKLHRRMRKDANLSLFRC